MRDPKPDLASQTPPIGQPVKSLSDLKKGETGTIISFDPQSPDLSLRLREIGFAEGDHVTPLHFGLFGRDPMSVRVNGALIALRRVDARAILVTP